jgi:hypothetical protein
MGACLAVGGRGLEHVNTLVRTPVGALGVGTGSHPVVELAGLESDGHGFAALSRRLQAEGVTVLDFDPSRAGVQPLTWKDHTHGKLLPAPEVVALISATLKAG